MNRGNVNIYMIFLCAGACMLSHSVKVVSAPNININKVKLNRQKKIEDKDEVIITPVDMTPVRPKMIIAALNTIVIIVSSIAGHTVISMS